MNSAHHPGQQRHTQETAQTTGLTLIQAKALARRLAAHQLANHENWLEWENIPNLGQYAFELLTEQMDVLADEMLLDSQQYDHTWNIDSPRLLEELGDGA